MTANKAGEQPTITQADIEAVNDWDREWKGCHGWRPALVRAFAKHRITSLAAQDVEREPMREYCNEAIYEPKVADSYPRPSLAAQDGLVEALERISSGRSSVTECSLIARQALSAIKGDKS